MGTYGGSGGGGVAMRGSLDKRGGEVTGRQDMGGVGGDAEVDGLMLLETHAMMGTHHDMHIHRHYM